MIDHRAHASADYAAGAERCQPPREHRRKSTPTSFGWWGCVLGGRVESDYNANHDQNMI